LIYNLIIGWNQLQLIINMLNIVDFLEFMQVLYNKINKDVGITKMETFIPCFKFDMEVIYVSYGKLIL